MNNAMKIAVLPGDGIGREVVPQAIKVLRALERTGLDFDFTHGLVDAAAVEAGDEPLPQRTLDLARVSGAILFGAVGDPANDKLPRSKRAGSGLERLRKELRSGAATASRAGCPHGHRARPRRWRSDRRRGGPWPEPGRCACGPVSAGRGAPR